MQSPEIRPYFHDLIRAFTNWQPFILKVRPYLPLRLERKEFLP